MAECPKTQKQINIAQNQRNASRDYHEYHIHLIQSPKILMMTLSESELDELSINNEKNFKYRFGRSFNFEIRKKIIELKRENQWTTKDTRQLLVTGGIQINPSSQTVKTYREPYSYFAAWLLIGLVTIYYAGFILLLSNLPNTLKVFLAQFIIAGICISTFRLYHWTFISPYHLLAKANKHSATN